MSLAKSILRKSFLIYSDISKRGDEGTSVEEPEEP
jgi:hypothetical protein